MTATGAFATIILERLLDIVTVLVLLASYVFVFGRDLGQANPMVFVGLKWAGATAGAGVARALIVLFVLAGDPARLGRTMTRLEQVLPSTLAGLIAKIAEKFARGLGAIRRPGRLLVALAWSFPLWLSIALGIWAVAVAFRFAMPFTGSFLLIALLVHRRRRADARRDRRLSRGVSRRRDDVLRRARRRGGRRGDRAARRSRSARRCCSVCSSPPRKG